MVEHSPQHPNVVGLTLDPRDDTGRERMGEIQLQLVNSDFKTFSSFLSKIDRIFLSFFGKVSNQRADTIEIKAKP